MTESETPNCPICQDWMVLVTDKWVCVWCEIAFKALDFQVQRMDDMDLEVSQRLNLHYESHGKKLDDGYYYQETEI